MHISAALFDNPRNLYTVHTVVLTVEYVNLIPAVLCMEMALLRPPSPKTFHEQRVEIQSLSNCISACNVRWNTNA